jgi:hypothetical protein
MRAVVCPGCHHTMMVKGDERARCSPCSDPVRSEDDGETVRHFNRYGKIVGRERSRQAGPQSAVRQYGTHGYDPGAVLEFGNFAFIGGSARRKR